ncbi:MAG: helix-turn-helix transcriptional regulator [Lachnospiraceae bacterium]|nr:helix-turn-helix transcriptional regulator [Lachnospiraceae bacterium]
MNDKRKSTVITDTSGRDYLRSIRKKYGLTQQGLAENAGISVSTVKNVEILKTPLSLKIKSRVEEYDERAGVMEESLEDIIYRDLTFSRSFTEAEKEKLHLLAYQISGLVNNKITLTPDGVDFLTEIIPEMDYLCNAAYYSLKSGKRLSVRQSTANLIPRLRSFIDQRIQKK